MDSADTDHSFDWDSADSSDTTTDFRIHRWSPKRRQALVDFLHRFEKPVRLSKYSRRPPRRTQGTRFRLNFLDRDQDDERLSTYGDTESENEGDEGTRGERFELSGGKEQRSIVDIHQVIDEHLGTKDSLTFSGNGTTLARFGNVRGLAEIHFDEIDLDRDSDNLISVLSRQTQVEAIVFRFQNLSFLHDTLPCGLITALKDATLSLR